MREIVCAFIASLSFLSGCVGPKAPAVAPIPKTPPQSSLRFASVARQAGIDFRLGHNGRSPLNILETAGGGCAFLDYDGDGWPDILLVGPHNLELYHNERNGRFKSVTAASGLDPKPMWMGCAVGDYDGDGRPDIFLTGYRCCALYRNLGGGRFQDVTRESGISGLDWCLSAAFADLSGHGRLDLFVSQYVKFDDSTPHICEVGRTRSACGPEMYDPLSGKLFINKDGRHFEAANWKDTGKTWGVLVSNMLNPRRPSIYLANDLMPGDLWESRKGSWQNLGPSSGAAYDAMGHLQGGMGVDAGDYDNDGKVDLVVTTYFAQQTSIYHNDGHDLFTPTSGSSGLGPPTTPFVGFGVSFSDLDNDGWLDLVIANGHVRDNVHDFDSSQSYAQPIQMFRNEQGHFIDVSSIAQTAAHEKIVGRGLSVADYDHDGRLDILICNLEGEAVLLRNESEPRHWLDVRLQGTGMNRFGVGSTVTVKAGGLTQVREIRTCGGVLSAREPVAHFGLGSYSGPIQMEILWPDGTVQTEALTKLDTTVSVKQNSNVAVSTSR